MFGIVPESLRFLQVCRGTILETGCCIADRREHTPGRSGVRSEIPGLWFHIEHSIAYRARLPIPLKRQWNPEPTLRLPAGQPRSRRRLALEQQSIA